VAKIEKLTPRTTEIAYEWAFGDGSEVVSDSQKTGGNASIEVKREHGFEKNGDYTVTFQAFDVTRSPKRKLGEAQARVRVESFALAIEHQPTEVEEGKPVTFTAKLTSGTLPTDGRFAWDFGDGASSPPGSAASVQHAYGKHTKSHKVTVTLTSASDPSRILARAERTVVVGMNCETACAGEMEGSLDCIVCRHVPDPDQKVVRQPHDVVQEP
jgi:PKD repeat protein